MTALSNPKADLAWCLTSPPLVKTTGWPGQDWFDALPRPGEDIELTDPPDPHRFRLGAHFERLLRTWLEAADGFEVIAANLPVRSGDGKRTLGEFDFIVKTPTGIEHWEAAVKFYLGTGDSRSLGDWIGPNTADRLGIKFDRLITHQLVLAGKPEAQALLAERGIEIETARCFMKGRLFHPVTRFESTAWQMPEVINPDHARGWWISYADFLARFEDRAARYVYLPKSLWLAPIDPAEHDPLSFWEIKEFLESPHVEQATHIAVVDDDREISRGFVVTDRWLSRITPD